MDLLFGGTVKDVIHKSVAMEKIAEMAYKTLSFKNKLNQKKLSKIPKYLIDYHYTRKHGPNKYYGQ